MKKRFTNYKFLYGLIVVFVSLTIIFISLAAFLYFKYVSPMGEMKQVMNEKLELEDDKKKLQNEIDECHEQIERVKSINASVDETNEKLERENFDLTEQIQNLQAQEHTEYNSMAQVSSSSDNVGTEEDDSYSTIVYWTPDGKVYHSTIDCPSLGRSSTICSGTIAQSGKGRACKNCY